MNKAVLRKRTIEKLKILSDQEKLEIEKKLREQLIHSKYWRKANTIGITISQGFEWDTKSIIEEAWNKGKRVCVPKCFSNKKMEFYQLDHFRQLEKGLHKIPEPIPEKTRKVEKNEMELIIVPGIVFDIHGYRIGFGGGFYDRYLAGFSNQTISLACHEQILDQIPIDTHDIPVHHIITENGKL